MALDQKTDGVWKSGKGKGRKTPKGRQVNEQAIDDIKLLLGNRFFWVWYSRPRPSEAPIIQYFFPFNFIYQFYDVIFSYFQ